MIPAFDATAFAKLVEDLDLSVAAEFLITFNGLLVSRIERIEQALRGHDDEEITTALLSLQASAAMVGAAQLEASATRALTQQPAGFKPSGGLVRELQGQADTFKAAIVSFPTTAISAVHQATG